MATIDALLHRPRATTARAAASAGSTSALRTLVRRRFALNIRTPRELLVPLLTPVLFALVIAPALADRIPSQEEYVGALPAVAIVPWFFAGSLFPIGAMPAALAAFAKVLPLTHALAVMRYGLVDEHGVGLHDIWGMSSPTVMAFLSLAVVAAYAILFTVVAVTVFRRATVR